MTWGRGDRNAGCILIGERKVMGSVVT